MKKYQIVIIAILAVAILIVALSYHRMKMEVSEPVDVLNYNSVSVSVKYEDKTESFVIWALTDSEANRKALRIFNEEKQFSMYSFAYYLKKYAQEEQRYELGFKIPKSFKVFNFMGEEINPLSEEDYNSISDEGKFALPDTLQKYWDCMDTLKVIKQL